MKRLLLSTVCLLAASSLSLEQKPHLITHWENFTTGNGMPDPKVFCVAVDGNRVWAGTEDGLALVENGKVQRVYKTEDGLVQRAVMGIAVDKKTGDLWIATFGGVSHFSGGQFQNFTNLTSGLLNDVCYGIAVVDQYVWVATTAGVSRLNTYTGEWTNWSEKNAPFHEPWSYGIAPAGNKMYFAIWGGGLLEYDVAGNYWKPYTDPDEEMEIVLSAIRVSCISSFPTSPITPTPRWSGPRPISASAVTTAATGIITSPRTAAWPRTSSMPRNPAGTKSGPAQTRD